MIQYQYFHTSKGYVVRLSINEQDSNFHSIEDLFETVRKNTEGNTFTYASVGMNGFFMQSSKNNNDIFVKGLLCDNISDIPVAPSRYIDKFEKNVSSEDAGDRQLPAGKLPELGRKVDDFSLAQNLHHIFPKLVDALIYDDSKKKIIIIADSHDSAVNYVKVLSLILPMEFTKRLGFCIGSASIPYDNMTWINENGTTEEITIRIWLPEMIDFDFDTYASFYYVFDTNTGKNNYSRSLSSTAKVLEEINLCDFARAQDFANRISVAFTNDGKVQFDLLEQISSLYLFELKKDVDSAKAILGMGSSGNGMQEYAVSQAIQFLLEPNNSQHLTAVDLSSIMREYKSNSYVAQETEEAIFNYLSNSYSTLSEDEKYELIKMIANDDQGVRLESFLRRTLRGDFKALLEAFELGLSVLKMSFETNGYRIISSKKIVQKLIEFFDFVRIRSKIIGTGQYITGEEFFDIVWRTYESELKYIAIAILMGSAYFSSAIPECRTVRIRGFRRMLTNAGITPLEQLNFIIMVRDKMLEISDEIPELKIFDNQSDFLLDNELGRLWCTELISSLTVDAAIKAYESVRSLTSGTRFYESLSNAIRSRLLDINFVRKNVKSGSPVLSKYVEFFDTLPQEVLYESSDVQKYLAELNLETRVSDEFSDYRCEFAFECYETLSASDQQKVVRNSDKISFVKLGKQEKIKAVENTIKVFGTVFKAKKNNQARIKPFVIWAFAFSILSIFLLILPAIVQGIMLGAVEFSLFVERVVRYIKPGYIVIPLYVFVLNITTYLTLREGNKIKRANIITLLCGILPIFMFSVGYLICYFWGLNIDIPFLNNFSN